MLDASGRHGRTTARVRGLSLLLILHRDQRDRRDRGHGDSFRILARLGSAGLVHLHMNTFAPKVEVSSLGGSDCATW